MTKHWLFITVYILFIAVLTYFVATYTEAEKVVTFLENQETEISDNNLKLLSATVAANRNDGTDAIIKKEPLYQEIFVEGDNKVEVYIYTLIEYHESQSNHALVILLKDLSIDDDTLYQDEDQYSQIKAYIEFNDMINFGSTKTRSFNETFVTLYNDKQKLILFNYDRLESQLPIVFKYIQISYQDENGMFKSFVNLNNSDISSKQADVFNESYERDIKGLTENDISLIDQGLLVDFKSNHTLYYDGISSLLDSYNSLYFKNISIELLFVIPVTYLVFFNAYVISYFKEKRSANKEAHLMNQLAIKKKLEKEHKE